MNQTSNRSNATPASATEHEDVNTKRHRHVIVPRSRVRSYADDFITKQEVAKRLHRSTRFVEKLMRRGLPFYRIGRCPLFRWDEVKDYFATSGHVNARASIPASPASTPPVANEPVTANEPILIPKSE